MDYQDNPASEEFILELMNRFPEKFNDYVEEKYPLAAIDKEELPSYARNSLKIVYLAEIELHGHNGRKKEKIAKDKLRNENIVEIPLEDMINQEYNIEIDDDPIGSALGVIERESSQYEHKQSMLYLVGEFLITRAEVLSMSQDYNENKIGSLMTRTTKELIEFEVYNFSSEQRDSYIEGSLANRINELEKTYSH